MPMPDLRLPAPPPPIKTKIQSPTKADTKSPLYLNRTGRSRILVFGFTFVFIAFTTLHLAFNPSTSSSPRWLNTFLRTTPSSQESHSSSLSLALRPPPPPLPPRSRNPPPPLPLPPPPPPSSKRSSRKKKMNKRAALWKKCNVFDGRWVRDDSHYPLYLPGSCPHIDEPFNCHVNGRPDSDYLRYRWQPHECNLPRLNGRKMLKLLRGKRLVFVGDSLNRNMWESLVCILRNSVKDKSKVFEVSGREEFRTEGSYSFIFKDYGCSIEFFRTPFLVQEWEVPDTNGSARETLRLDLVEGSADKYKTADILVFNTGHWWTHEKTTNGKGYYQEGNHIYKKLSGDRAFRKALSTWARWIDSNTDPAKTLVFFRGYSPSHFRGGSWNSGGQCDDELEPELDAGLETMYPSIVRIFELVMQRMKRPVFYLNITRMTDFRKDAHPSVYRTENSTEEERKSTLIPQDCSHWCLPGIPDTWNELLYYHLLNKWYERRQKSSKEDDDQGHDLRLYLFADSPDQILL